MIMDVLHWSVFIMALLQVKTVASSASQTTANVNEKVYTPFFLQDRSDKSCLGMNGFTFCNENSLWLLLPRPETSKFSLVPFINPSEDGLCLEVVSKWFRSKKLKMGSCTHSGSKKWNYEFVNASDIKMSSQGMSISRGKPYQSSLSLVSSDSDDYVPLYYYPTNIHEAGFYLKASSDGYCFDGNAFRLCDKAKEVLFGVGFSFSWRGTAGRYFFNYYDKSKCLNVKRNNVYLGLKLNLL